MKISMVLSLSCLVGTLSCLGQSDVPSKPSQIAAALQAAPESMRQKAAVWGYTPEGKFVELRPGTNDMICVSDDPNRKGFSTASYHKDLQPFMLRGRELRAQGIDGQALFDKRESEVKAGTLKMPSQPTTLHILTGESFSEDSMKIMKPYYRYVVYIPFATPATTGLPPSPRAPGEPWIMDPGTHRAHIMITPPKNK